MLHAPDRTQIDLADVLNALGSPLRLAIVQRLADGSERRCGSLVQGVSKSTLTHHWRVLLAAGVITQRPSGRENLLSLRRADLDARFPGLLDSALTALTADPASRERIAAFDPTDI
ncbi:ArsR family transcriptional regulator [Mycetocola tolaasinivorans]|uniref:ArsR family transcriptional regulator n=1 Tax=Mycetocola tolaasinivorans TaxID=76635 RepID=A0A3L7A5U8_9MICO|nr:helix-turn-helix domain-containing protein [Mycetocola tolaasinivorans]RLP75713.1 ArsR family transcriptional regulator [Mycetocola tolaasinivorans]